MIEKAISKPEKYFQRSVEAIKTGQYSKGKKWLKIANFYNHPTEQIHLQQGIIALEELRLIEAIHKFHAHLSMKTDGEQDVQYYLGLCFFYLGNREESIIHFNNAFEKSTSLLIQCKALVCLEKILGYSSEKLNQLIQKKFHYLLNIDLQDSEEKRTNAILASIKGNHDNAISLLKEVIKTQPKLKEAYKELSDCYLRIKNYELAIKTLKQCKTIGQNDKIITFTLAKLYYLSHNFSKAKRLLLPLLKVVPNNATLYFNTANTFYKTKQLNKAARYYLKTIELNDQFYPAYFNLGTLYQKAGVLTQSKEYYEKAKEINPNFFQVHYNLGILYYNQKNYFESLNSFVKAEKINPKDQRAIHNFGIIKNLKLIDPNNDSDQQFLTLTNTYLAIIAILLLLLYLIFK